MNTLLLTFSYPPVADNIAGRFGYVIAALRWILFRFPNNGPAERSGLISNRLTRLGNRFAALYARVQAGTLRPSRPGATKRVARPSSSRPLDCLPRRRGWLAELLPAPGRADAGVLAGQLLSAVENDPEMQAFLAAAPQAGRILRPLLRMLTARKLPEALRLPKRPDPAPDPKAAPSPIGANFALGPGVARLPSPCGRGLGEGEIRRDLACGSPPPNPPPLGGKEIATAPVYVSADEPSPAVGWTIGPSAPPDVPRRIDGPPYLKTD